jgi:hypothetical protein
MRVQKVLDSQMIKGHQSGAPYFLYMMLRV